MLRTLHIISQELYDDLQSHLNRHSDIPALAKEHGLPEDTLLVIYTQKVTRDATRRYYRVKGRARKFYHQWRSGKPLMHISAENRYPPVLTAFIVLLEGELTRKEFWRVVANPDRVGDARLRRELKEIVRADPIYSPAGNEVQVARGREGERQLQEWLDRHGQTYRTEVDLRGKFPKTPDVLLDSPLELDGTKVFWIESKGNFGDKVEVGRNLKRQLWSYADMFGPGLVIYWYGVIEGLQGRTDDVFVGVPETLDGLVVPRGSGAAASAAAATAPEAGAAPSSGGAPRPRQPQVLPHHR